MTRLRVGPTARRSARRLGDGLGALVFVVPGVLWLAVFFLVPLVMILLVSIGSAR